MGCKVKGRIRRLLAIMCSKELAVRLALKFGKILNTKQRTLATQEGKEDLQQQHPPLEEAHPTANPKDPETPGKSRSNQLRQPGTGATRPTMTSMT